MVDFNINDALRRFNRQNINTRLDVQKPAVANDGQGGNNAQNLVKQLQSNIIKNIQQQVLIPQNIRMNHLASVDRSVYIKNLLKLPDNITDLLIAYGNKTDGKQINENLNQNQQILQNNKGQLQQNQNMQQMQNFVQNQPRSNNVQQQFQSHSQVPNQPNLPNQPQMPNQPVNPQPQVQPPLVPQNERNNDSGQKVQQDNRQGRGNQQGGQEQNEVRQQTKLPQQQSDAFAKTMQGMNNANRPQLPQNQGQPQAQNQLNLPNQPNMQNQPQMPNRPLPIGQQGVPQQPQVQGQAQAQTTPNLPNQPNMPNQPQMPNRPLPNGQQGVPQQPQVQGQAQVPNQPNMPNRPDAAGQSQILNQQQNINNAVQNGLSNRAGQIQNNRAHSQMQNIINNQINRPIQNFVNDRIQSNIMRPNAITGGAAMINDEPMSVQNFQPQNINEKPGSPLNIHNRLQSQIMNNARFEPMGDLRESVRRQIRQPINMPPRNPAEKIQDEVSQELRQLQQQETAQLAMKEVSARVLPSRVNLSMLNSQIQMHSRQALNSLILEMSTATRQGITDTKPIQDTIGLINASISASSQDDTALAIKNLMLLYLPWLPLEEGVGFKLDVETKKSDSSADDDTSISIMITTKNYGNISAEINLITSNSVDIFITCDKTFPKEDLLKRLRTDSKEHSMTASIGVEETSQKDSLAPEVQKAKVNLSNVTTINPYLLLMAHSFIRHAIEIDINTTMYGQPAASS
ncbi:hypothetical protein IJ818_04320 [bacterium]|nr:hypothetical protein [bacterium]